MTDDNDDDADDDNFDDTFNEILGASSRVATSLDLSLLAPSHQRRLRWRSREPLLQCEPQPSCTSLLSPLSPLPPPIASPPPSAAAGEPI